MRDPGSHDYNLFPFNRRMSVFSSKGRRDRHDLVDYVWHLLFIGSFSFFKIHPGIDPFLIQKKEIKHLVPEFKHQPVLWCSKQTAFRIFMTF